MPASELVDPAVRCTKDRWDMLDAGWRVRAEDGQVAYFDTGRA